MPDIYTYFGFIFSFYSNEHEPIHVHVEHGNKMTIFDLIIVNGELIEIKKRDKGEPLSSKDEKMQKVLSENTGKISLKNGFLSLSTKKELDVQTLKRK